MRIRPLSLVATGVAVVGFDPRVLAVDLLPDPLGWALVAFGAWRLSVPWASRLASVAAVASLVEVRLSYHYDSLDPITGEVVPTVLPGQSFVERLAFDMVEGPRLLALVIAVSAGGAALWSLLRELRRRAVSSHDVQSADRLAWLAWAVAGVWALPYVAVAVGRGLVGDGFDPVWNGAWEIPAVAGMAAMGAIALLFATTSNRRWSASGDELGSPWAEMMLRGLDA